MNIYQVKQQLFWYKLRFLKCNGLILIHLLHRWCLIICCLENWSCLCLYFYRLKRISFSIKDSIWNPTVSHFKSSIIMLKKTLVYSFRNILWVKLHSNITKTLSKIPPAYFVHSRTFAYHKYVYVYIAMDSFFFLLFCIILRKLLVSCPSTCSFDVHQFRHVFLTLLFSLWITSICALEIAFHARVCSSIGMNYHDQIYDI